MKTKNKSSNASGLRGFNKFHAYLSVATILSFLAVGMYHATGENILAGILMALGIVIITTSIFFNMFAIVYHIVKSSGKYFILLSVINLLLLALMLIIALAAYMMLENPNIGGMIFNISIIAYFLAYVFITFMVFRETKSKVGNYKAPKKRSGTEKRGLLLTILLIWFIIGNLLGVITRIVSEALFKQLSVYYNDPLSVTALFAVLDSLFVISILKWKKWGVYGFIAVRALFYINVLYSLFRVASFSDISMTARLLQLAIGVAISAFALILIFNKWRSFE